MDEAEAELVKAEVIALQAVLMSVFRRIVVDRADLAPLFCQAFDEAETIMAGVAVKLGLDAPVGSMAGAMKIVEELRRAVIPDESACRPVPTAKRDEIAPG
ncbi:hypothetical protein [Allosphingosinicella vermicomposti]|uniref:hypothetical protein n=1 Tax=Allosphingosinicella vermicomposti TaxID=614671 RepID=UPI000D0E6F0B|nr:hypothetical protein [Allosphingosinicella vermicomposti]